MKEIPFAIFYEVSHGGRYGALVVADSRRDAANRFMTERSAGPMPLPEKIEVYQLGTPGDGIIERKAEFKLVPPQTEARYEKV